MSDAFVCILGVATVFIGLIFLIILVYIMSAVCKIFTKSEPAAIGSAKAPGTQTAPVASADAPIANKQEIVAGVCAVIAEELGTDVKNIKVVSFKRA